MTTRLILGSACLFLEKKELSFGLHGTSTRSKMTERIKTCKFRLNPNHKFIGLLLYNIKNIIRILIYIVTRKLFLLQSLSVKIHDTIFKNINIPQSLSFELSQPSESLKLQKLIRIAPLVLFLLNFHTFRAKCFNLKLIATNLIGFSTNLKIPSTKWCTLNCRTKQLKNNYHTHT